MTEKQLKKYLKNNYDIWKYATKGMSEFKCTGCGVCCKTKVVELLPEEYQVLRKKLPKNKFVKIPLGNNHYIPALKPPCPFLNQDNSCNIHQDRMFACWIFPMTIHTGKFPHGIQFMVNESCPDIVPGEQYNFTKQEYLWAVSKLFSLADLDNNPTWLKLRKEIENLKTHIPKKQSPPTFTWCSVCQRPYKKGESHQHPTPKDITKKINFVTKLGQQFINNKRQFQALLHHFLKFNRNHQSLPHGGMKWKKEK